jgi:glutathione synthase
MKLKLFFVADPLDKLNPKSDSTLALLRESQKRGHHCYWVTESEVEYVDNKVVLRARACGPFSAQGVPELGETEVHLAESFHAGFIRKDPPFNEDYVRLCWILALTEKKVFYVNKPSLLVRYHEKLVPLEAFAQGFLKKADIIPSHLGSGPSAAAFVQNLQSKTVISKPFLGHGGKNISQTNKEKFVADGLQKPERWEGIVVQPFLEEVLTEDRRLLVIDGKIRGQFVRIPPPGGFIANLAQGGSAESRPLSKRQKEVGERVAKFLKKVGIVFAGVDLIGSKVSEVNITSPTGFLSYEKLSGINLSTNVLDTIERSVLRRKR